MEIDQEQVESLNIQIDEIINTMREYKNIDQTEVVSLMKKHISLNNAWNQDEYGIMLGYDQKNTKKESYDLKRWLDFHFPRKVYENAIRFILKNHEMDKKTKRIHQELVDIHKNETNQIKEIKNQQKEIDNLVQENKRIKRKLYQLEKKLDQEHKERFEEKQNYISIQTKINEEIQNLKKEMEHLLENRIIKEQEHNNNNITRKNEENILHNNSNNATIVSNCDHVVVHVHQNKKNNKEENENKTFFQNWFDNKYEITNNEKDYCIVSEMYVDYTAKVETNNNVILLCTPTMFGTQLKNIIGLGKSKPKCVDGKIVRVYYKIKQK